MEVLKWNKYRVYDSRDNATLFVGTKQQCLNYIYNETTFGEQEYVWFEQKN